MELPRYQARVSNDHKVYSFVSTGKNGNFLKKVIFEETDQKGLFNLSLGDFNIETKELDFYSVTDNGDRDKILATVVACLFSFFKYNPKAWVYAVGSTPATPRLYRIGISKHLQEVKEDFEIFGELEDRWERFKTNTNYSSFIIKLTDEEN
jgi:hypothetical protein